VSRLLQISSSPRGAASESLQIAETFIDAYRHERRDAEVEVVGPLGRHAGSGGEDGSLRGCDAA